MRFQPGEGPSSSRGLLRNCDNRLSDWSFVAALVISIGQLGSLTHDISLQTGRAVLTQYLQYLSSQRAHLTCANNKYFAQDLTTSHCHTVCIIFKNYTNYSCWDPAAEAVREMSAIWLSCCSRLVSFLQSGDATALKNLSISTQFKHDSLYFVYKF